MFGGFAHEKRKLQDNTKYVFRAGSPSSLLTQNIVSSNQSNKLIWIENVFMCCVYWVKRVQDRASNTLPKQTLDLTNRIL